MRILWLSGFAGSGKDTVAQILCKKFDYTRVAFADGLKDTTATKYGFDRELCDTVEGKKTQRDTAEGKKTIRDLLIEESAKAKELDLNIYARRVLDTIYASNQQLWVISDWRFPHEYDFLKSALPEAQHTTIRISRVGWPILQVPSEHQLDTFPFDVVIMNNNLAVFEQDILRYMRTIKS